MKNNQKKPTITSIEAMRLLAIFGVICIHITPFRAINSTVAYAMTQVLPRFAVPFFFVVSGYFYSFKLQESGGSYPQMWVKVKRLLRLYLLWYLVYSGYQLVYIVINLPSFLNGSSLLNGLRVFWIEPTQVHLWYLPALIIATVAMTWLHRVLKGNVLAIMGMIIVLFVLGVLGDGYYHTFNTTAPIKQILDIFGTTRNGFFFAIPFFATGYLLKAIDASKIIRYKHIISLSLIIALVLLAYESFRLLALDQFYDANILFTLMPLTILLFLWCLLHPTFLSSWNLGNYSRYSLGMYLNHMIIIFLSYLLLPLGTLRNLAWFEVLYPGIIFGGSMVLTRLMYHSRFKWIQGFVKA